MFFQLEEAETVIAAFENLYYRERAMVSAHLGLRDINVGLWIIHINAKNGEGELYTDETMRKLLGVDDITPRECFKHWQNNIDKEYRVAVDNMIHDMAESNNVIQVEYPWRHPQRDTVTVRCSGRCVEKNHEVIVFEGFHRVISDF